MRTLLFAVLMSAPIAAQAQTPQDLARLSWGSTAPAASVATAPTASLAAAGSASAKDLAYLSWAQNPPAVHSAAFAAPLASGATPRDLARLTGHARGLLTAPAALFAARTARPRG